MRKINLRGLSEVLNERELKNVMGGSDVRGSCGWKGATITPCLTNWSSDGSCPWSCASFNINSCVDSARESWCIE